MTVYPATGGPRKLRHWPRILKALFPSQHFIWPLSTEPGTALEHSCVWPTLLSKKHMGKSSHDPSCPHHSRSPLPAIFFKPTSRVAVLNLLPSTPQGPTTFQSEGCQRAPLQKKVGAGSTHPPQGGTETVVLGAVQAAGIFPMDDEAQTRSGAQALLGDTPLFRSSWGNPFFQSSWREKASLWATGSPTGAEFMDLQ